MSPAEKEARQMMADKKAAEAAEKAYNAASKTPPAPASAEKKPKVDLSSRVGMNEMVDKKAKGGVTRADGCVSKGHTKGKMVKMAYGGKAC